VSKNTWLAGDEFTAADVMIVFSLTTMRLYVPYNLEGFEGILGYLKRVGERERL
jgi:glutathione S-transferase